MKTDFINIKILNGIFALKKAKTFDFIALETSRIWLLKKIIQFSPSDLYPNARFFILFILFFLGGRIREHAELVVQSELGSPSDGRGGAQFD